MRVVLTGAPCSGKTSIFNYINTSQSSFNKQIITVPESAREWLIYFKEYEPHKLPQNNREFFQQFIETIQIQNYHKLWHWEKLDDSVLIYDRSIIDELAYRNFYDIDIDDDLGMRCQEKYEFDRVYFFPFWEEIYVNDSERLETIEEAKRMDILLREAYSDCGYEVVEVPFGTLEERFEFIVNDMNKYGY